MDLKTANRLAEYRKNNGFSQEDLANKLNVSRQAVSNWERGETSPEVDTLIELSKIYNVSLDEMVFGKDEISVEENDEIDNKEYILNIANNVYILNNTIYANYNGYKMNIDVKKYKEIKKLSETISQIAIGLSIIFGVLIHYLLKIDSLNRFIEHEPYLIGIEVFIFLGISSIINMVMEKRKHGFIYIAIGMIFFFIFLITDMFILSIACLVLFLFIYYVVSKNYKDPSNIFSYMDLKFAIDEYLNKKKKEKN